MLAGAAIYLLIRFGAAGAVARCITVHRGMFHSIPAAVIFGEIAFLLASGDDLRLAGLTRPGRSCSAIYRTWCSTKSRASSGPTGCAEKFLRHRLESSSAKWLWSNLSAYAKLLILTAIILFEPQCPIAVYAGRSSRSADAPPG